MSWKPDNSFWAAVFILWACVLAVIALYAPASAEKAAVITMASSIITGAFGYIQGRKDGADAATPPPPVSPEVRP